MEAPANPVAINADTDAIDDTKKATIASYEDRSVSMKDFSKEEY